MSRHSNSSQHRFLFYSELSCWLRAYQFLAVVKIMSFPFFLFVVIFQLASETSRVVGNTCWIDKRLYTGRVSKWIRVHSSAGVFPVPICLSFFPSLLFFIPFRSIGFVSGVRHFLDRHVTANWDSCRSYRLGNSPSTSITEHWLWASVNKLSLSKDRATTS